MKKIKSPKILFFSIRTRLPPPPSLKDLHIRAALPPPPPSFPPLPQLLSRETAVQLVAGPANLPPPTWNTWHTAAYWYTDQLLCDWLKKIYGIDHSAVVIG